MSDTPWSVYRVLVGSLGLLRLRVWAAALALVWIYDAVDFPLKGVLLLVAFRLIAWDVHRHYRRLEGAVDRALEAMGAIR